MLRRLKLDFGLDWNMVFEIHLCCSKSASEHAVLKNNWTFKTFSTFKLYYFFV